MKGTLAKRKAFHRSLRDLHSPLEPFLYRAVSEEDPRPWKEGLLLRRQEELLPFLDDPDEKKRKGAASILLCSDDTLVRSRLWLLFRDSSRDCRSLIIRQFRSSDRHLLFNSLFEAYIGDPVPSLRQAAHARLRSDFNDLFKISPKMLSPEQKIHCLELLDPHSAHDHNLALEMLEDERPGIVLAAALFLERTGVLDRLLREARRSDRKDFERRLSILRRAADHQVGAFLAKRKNLKSADSLLMALELFAGGAESPRFIPVISRLLKDRSAHPDFGIIRRRALDCLLQRRDPDSIALQHDLLHLRSWELFPILLEGLPAEGMQRFYPVLKVYLEDPGFPAWGALNRAYSRVPVSACLSDLNALLRDEERPFLVRKRALSLLIRLGESGTVLYLLEHLDLARPVEGLNLAAQAAEEQPEFFDSCVAAVYGSPDALLHQRMTAFLARSGNDRFVPYFLKQLDSPEPESRCAALRALGFMGGDKEMMRVRESLHDHVGEVRVSAAETLLDRGGDAIIETVDALLNDPMETVELKTALLKALGNSRHPRSLELLLSLRDWDEEELNESLLSNMAMKSGAGDMSLMIRAFAEGDASRRELLKELFLRMGHKTDLRLMELVESSLDPSLVSAAASVLKKNGFVDLLATRLRSPLVETRRKAALQLSLLGSPAACRALLPAARDINKEIRVLSMKALVRLEGSSPFLNDLASDPDGRIRRYARWAKRRIGVPSSGK